MRTVNTSQSLNQFSTKAEEDNFWSELEKERVAHDPGLAQSRFHTERIAAGRDKRVHYELIDAIRANTRMHESPSMKTVTTHLPTGPVSMTVHEIRGGSAQKGTEHGTDKSK
jgi:hypothetical protein